MQESCSSDFRACRLACIIIVLIVTSAAPTTSPAAPASDHASVGDIVGESCGDRTRCQWNIPPVPQTGCCPRASGQTCHPGVHQLCNREFGLSCVDMDNSSRPATSGIGVCQGPYNLTATTITQNQAVLEWKHFAPKDYEFEYALLLTKEAFHRDISRWTVRDCGPDPRCVMRRLEAGTSYLVKMAVWDDIRAMTFGITTETIVVTTKAVDHCEGEAEGSVYKVGESFIQERENCTCLPTGSIECHRLCSHDLPEMEEGCQMVLSEGCHYNITCDSNEGFQGSEEKLCSFYPEGTRLRFDCRICECQGREMLECSYTEQCNAVSPKPTCKNIKEIKVPGICCPEWECEDVCEYENKSYSAGEVFQSDSCGLCQCRPSGQVKCVSNCPPVEMVPPSMACPSPHVKRNGCCDTLHCFLTESDQFSYVHNLEVLYTTATTLTLGFPVEPLCKINGLPSYCYYRIQYANTSTHTDYNRWNNRVVRPVELSRYDPHPNYSHPLDVLTTDTAIAIGGRAVVTLTGMNPSTEFYVAVTQEEEVREDMSEIDESGAHGSLTAKVVVKTRSLQNVTSCFHSGRVVEHGIVVSETCDEECVCRLGQIVCQSTCEDESMVIAASLSCPRPRLERRDGDCCPTWHCHPSASGCRYKSALLRPGQVVSDGCEECVCTNASVRCVSLCPQTGTSPRSGCMLTNRSGHCCPQWSCPVETSIPIAVENSVLLRFLGSCQSPVPHFKKNLAQEIVAHVSKLMKCSDNKSLNSLCPGLRAAVECSAESSHEGSRKKRSESKDEGDRCFRVLVSVRRKFSPEEDREIISKDGRDLQELLTSNFSIRLASGYRLQPSHEVRLEKPVYICRRGFSYKNGHCVSSHYDITSSQWSKIALGPVDVTSRTATIQWPSLDDVIKAHVDSLYIKYRQTNTDTWTSTHKVPSWNTSIALSGLVPGTAYVGSLVGVGYDDKSIGEDDVDDVDEKDEDDGEEMFNDGDDDDDDGGGGGDADISTRILGDTAFRTLESSEDKAVTSLVIKKVSVTGNTAILYWGHLPEEFWKQVDVVSVLYWLPTSNVIHTITIENRELPFTTIEGLSSSTAYTAQMTFVLSSGQTVRSQSLRLTTLPAAKCENDFLLPALIACSGTVLLCIAVALVLMCWRHQKKNKKNQGIENKLYGITLENNAGSPSNGTPS